jgi:DNA-directed RNA polymerase specialized sigma24 family protein
MRLRALAGWLTRDQPDLFDAASAEDLVSETVLEFLRSPDSLGWAPARGKLEPFLCAVLKNKFIDHVRRHRRNRGPVTEEYLFPVPPEDRIEQQEVIDQIMRHVRGQKDLEDVVVAISESDGGPFLNQQVAAELQIPVAEVVNRKKRIRRSCEKQTLRPPVAQKEPQIR